MVFIFTNFIKNAEAESRCPEEGGVAGSWQKLVF